MNFIIKYRFHNVDINYAMLTVILYDPRQGDMILTSVYVCKKLSSCRKTVDFFLDMK